MIDGMNPTLVGAALATAPRKDCLHTIRLPRTPRDAHYLHRVVEAVTEGADRPLWAYPAPRTLVIRSPHLDEDLLPEGAALSTTVASVPAGDARVEWALVANPTRSTPTPKGPDGTRPKGRRYPLPEDDVPAWVVRKLLGPLLDISVTGVDRLPSLPGHNPRTGHTVTHTRYAVTGTARVADHQALADLLHAGVGPGKAFGCGLLLTSEVTDHG